MKRWILRWCLMLLTLCFCVPSSDAAEVLPLPAADRQARCQEYLDRAVTYLLERGFIAYANPDGILFLPQTITIIYQFAGCPAVTCSLPLNPDLYYYPALCWIYSRDWHDELGLKEAIDELICCPQKAETFQQNFEEKKAYNQDIVNVIYKLETDRLGGTPELSEEQLRNTHPYEDVNLEAGSAAPETNYTLSLLWARDRDLVSGILDEKVGTAVYFHPNQEKIGAGISTRGQFFVVLYLYALTTEV